MPVKEPETRKLSEQLQDVPQKKIEAKIAEDEKNISELKKKILKQKLRTFRNDCAFIAIMSFLLGFSWWSWTDEISVFKSLSLGLLWFLLFDELQIHRMFKQK